MAYDDVAGGQAVKRLGLLAMIVGALGAGAGIAHAWEAASTHAGLTETAAASSHLHARLRALGWDRGLYEPLIVPPEDASALIAVLHQYPPTGGFVPDARGRQFALAWLVAGSVIADGPFAANHFFDPQSGAGWSGPSRDAMFDVLSWMSRWQVFAAQDSWTRLRANVSGDPLPDQGVPAPAWIVAKDNPLGVTGFLDQYAKAVRSATPGERSRAMAGALVAAGAILHVLEDLGSPSHVRGDTQAHLARAGDSDSDRGSRFERIAALAYGRIGVPGPSRVVSRTSLMAFFTSHSAGGEPGLAEDTADHWFSPNTLPAPTRIGTGGRNVQPTLARPRPALPLRMNLMAASQPDGTTLSDADGVCLARYRVDRGILTFWQDDDCMLAEVDAILPEVSSYATGALDFLFRGELAVAIENGHAVAKAKGALGAGTLELLAEDGRGVRTSIKKLTVASGADGATLGDADLPDGARRAVALFTGVDGAGEPIVAVGTFSVK